MALVKAREDALAARLLALAAPDAAGWLATARAGALARLQAMGLPARRDEYWRYTDPAVLNAPDAPVAARFEARDESAPFDGMDRLRIVFVDGVFDADASDDLTLAGVRIERLATSGTADIHWAQSLYGVLESNGQMPVARPFAALNSAFATDGVLVHVTGKTAKPISLIYVHESDTSDAILHHCIKLDPGAELTLLENGPAAARFCKVMEVDVAEGASFHHVRLQGRDHARHAVTHLFARLAARAELRSFTLTANGRLTRNEAVIDLAGAESRAHLAGAAVGDGDFHHDDTVFVTHAAQACESRQVFKKVLMNGAVGVFQGKILVKQSAQKTDGYQISQSLLLDEDSQFLAKPELEIYADDVKCSHGSTSGAIDETALFYLQSRGVPRAAAQGLLVLAFLAEAIQEIADDTIADDIRDRLERWLNRHAAKAGK
ncbi:SufB Cysteine desulfurase activator SufB [Paracoccaceae bacterium]|jgi:Fe-S cluster assembly protein SufD